MGNHQNSKAAQRYLSPATLEQSLTRSQPPEEPAHLLLCGLVWTSLEAVQRAVGQDYVIMWRQKASDVVFPDDVETIRRDLEQGCRQLQGYHYQIVLRELQTLAGHPDRLHVWTRLAEEAAAKHN